MLGDLQGFYPVSIKGNANIATVQKTVLLRRWRYRLRNALLQC